MLIKQNFKKYPFIIKKALENLSQVLVSKRLRYARNRHRGMRSQRLESIKRVLIILLKRGCFQHDGIAVQILSNGEAIPCTIQEIATEAELSEKTVRRCLDDLKDAKFVQVSYQKKCGLNGEILLVAATLKQFTKFFWQTLGIYSLYVEAVKFAQTQKPIRLRVRLFQVTGAAKEWVHSLIQHIHSRQLERTTLLLKEDNTTRQQEARSCLEARGFRLGANCIQCSQRYLCKAIYHRTAGVQNI